MNQLHTKKVYLHTAHASKKDDRLSYAQWILKSPIETPNNLYHMNVSLSNAILPNSFDRVSSDLENNIMLIAWSTETNIPDEQAEMISSFKANKVLTIELPDPIRAVDLSSLIHALNRRLLREYEKSSDLQNIKHKPLFFYDSRFTDKVVFLKLDFSEDSWFFNPNQDTLEPFQKTTPTNDAIIKFKIVSESDVAVLNSALPGTTSNIKKIEARHVNLASQLGFAQESPAFTSENFVPTPYEIVDTSRSYWRFGSSSEIVKSVTFAKLPPSEFGSKFIKIRSNFATSNIDPVSLESENILTCLPIMDAYSQNPTIYYSGNLQSPGSISIPDSTLQKIELQLYDDHNRKMYMDRDWYVELEITMETAEKMDMYLGQEPLKRTRIMYSQSGDDPFGYQAAQAELSKTVWDMDYSETEQRNSQANLRRR